MNSEIPRAGTYAVDIRTGTVGQVMDSEGPYVQLRPPAGGREWDCPPAILRAAKTLEELSARVRELNQQSRLP